MHGRQIAERGLETVCISLLKLFASFCTSAMMLNAVKIYSHINFRDVPVNKNVVCLSSLLQPKQNLKSVSVSVSITKRNPPLALAAIFIQNVYCHNISSDGVSPIL
jgi:hypothetical protein